MRAFGYVFAATLVARLGSLGTFLVTTRVLAMADMGELTVWHSVRGMLLVALSIGLPDIIARETAVRRDSGAFLSGARASFTLLAVAAVVLELVLWLAPDWVALPHPRLLLVAAGVDLLPGLFMGSLAATGRIRAYALCIVVPALLASAGTVLLVLPPFSLGIGGALTAYIAASFVNVVLCLALLRPGVLPRGPRVDLRVLLRQSLPIFGAALAGTFIVTIDRYSLRWLDGPTSVAAYAVVFQAAALLSFGGASVRTSLLSRLIAHIDQRTVISRYFDSYVACGGMFAVFIAALAPEIIRLLAGVRYETQAPLAPVLCVAILALELYSFGQTLAVARQESHLAFRSILLAAGIAAVGVPLACHLAAAFGVGLALMTAYGTSALLILLPRADGTLRSLGWLAAVALCACVLAVHYQWVDGFHSGPSMALRYSLAAVCAVLGAWHLKLLGRAPTA